MDKDHALLCPVCVKANLKSMVEGETGWEPVGEYKDAKEYYDETGKRHVHDPNRVVSTWKCSQGHRFRWHVKAGCVACGQTQHNMFENI